ncbi:TolC family protein [Desulfosporosinus sp. PR]|uniref:TolC family protein n=1 Tax=Candidatus Desulfosporosinus nitrosoreducens TaxID=3401928 RepID=UPI0027EA3701|nr:TolC family protein [Desulfosporosinus sp. PR]MDQ7093919.1 TolC family protein [Desulfosporosinus sp. PR]
MKKSYLTLFTLVLSASIVFSTHPTMALDNAAQPASNTASVNTATATDTAPADTASGDSGSATAAEPATPPDTSTLSLSLDDALKAIETGNPDLKLADSQIQIYDKQNQTDLAQHSAGTAVTDEDSKKVQFLNFKRSQWTLDNAKHDRDNQLKDLKVDVTNQYETILALQQQADNYKTELANIDKLIDQANLQIKLGLQIPSSINSYTASKSKLEAAQKAVLNSINSDMITLKQDLGIDLSRNVVLTSTLIPYTQFDDSKLDNQIAEAIKNNYDIQRYTQDIDITQIEHDIDLEFDDKTSDQLEISIEDKKETLANLAVNQEVSLRTAYNNLKSLENTIAADKLTVEADQINLDTKQKNVDVGTASSLDLINLQNTLLNDQNTLQQDINTYMTAVANFQNSLDD